MCGNFEERHSFHIVLSELPENLRKLYLSQKFHTRKLDEIMVFYEVKEGTFSNFSFTVLSALFVLFFCNLFKDFSQY